MAFYKHVRASANGLKTTDVIGLQSLGGQEAYTIYSILEITAAVYFTIFMVHYIRYGNSVFCKMYTVYVGNLF